MRTVTTGPSTRSSTLSRVRMEASGKLEFCLQRDIGHRDISSYQLLCFGKNRYPFAKRVTLDHSPRYFPIILRVSWSFGNSIPQDVSTLSLYHVLCFKYLISCTPACLHVTHCKQFLLFLQLSPQSMLLKKHSLVDSFTVDTYRPWTTVSFHAHFGDARVGHAWLSPQFSPFST